MSSSCITQQAIGQYTLPVYNRTVAYVRNLIETYNALVKNSTYINRPDFDNVKANFSLYRNAGYSFKVVVAQSVPDTSAYVALIFIPIRADQPNVTMDYNDTMLSLFGGAFYIAGQNSILKNNVVQYGNIIVQVPFIFVILSTDISSANY